MNAPSRFLLTLSGVVATACSSPARQAAPLDTAVPPPATVRTRVMVGDRFSPRTDAAAIAAFVPEIAPVDSGGECDITRTGGNGATVASVAFPRLANAQTRMSVTFDSSGRLVRFSERRGVMPPLRFGPEVTAAARDSAFRDAVRRVRSTTITFDYVIDQAVVMNSGGGRPTDAVLGTVRMFESLERLGPPRAHVARLRALCGV